jgi:transposase
MVLAGKFADHLPLNRQSEAYAREGIDPDVSTLADWIGACAATLASLVMLIRAHVLAGARIHGDDTTVPVLAKGKTVAGRLWTYVRDDRPFGGDARPAALFHYLPDRTAAHPLRHLAGWQGILQADAYAGVNGLYDGARQPGPVIEAGCWAHDRRKFSHDRLSSKKGMFPLRHDFRCPKITSARRVVRAPNALDGRSFSHSGIENPW